MASRPATRRRLQVRDDDLCEIAPGRFKAARACTLDELEASAALCHEKTELANEIYELVQLACDQLIPIGIRPPRALSRRLDKFAEANVSSLGEHQRLRDELGAFLSEHI